MYMTDEAGADAKAIAVPHEKLSSMCSVVKECSDLPALLLAQIQHFFENFKALEPGKWVKMGKRTAMSPSNLRHYGRWCSRIFMRTL